MVDDAEQADPGTGLGPARPGLLILALSVFTGVTTETLPVGLLPSISRTFGVEESTTGLLVSLYAALVAVLAVPLTLVTRRLPRKRLLLLATGCFLASNVLSALAPTFAVLAVARAVGGATHAIFFSLCIGYAARLVPAARTGAALALASTGVSAGFVLGVPLGTAIGNAIGWRGAFAGLAVLMAVAFVLIAVGLPAVETSVDRGDRQPGGRIRLLAATGSNALAYTGHYALYTYVTVLLLHAGADAGLVAPILLLFGGCGLLAVVVVGRQLDRHFRRGSLVVLTVLCAGLLGTGKSGSGLALVVIAGCFWNGAFGPVAAIHQTAAIRTGATTEDCAGAWVVATSNVGIAAGAALGGAVLNAAGISTVAVVAAVPLALAAVVVGWSRRTFPAST